jgi:hypothetical protein
MIKLKNILKESFTWERKSDGSLPTLADYKKLKEGPDRGYTKALDEAYDNLHNALQKVHMVIKENQQKTGDRKALKAFREWWGKLDRFYPPLKRD